MQPARRIAGGCCKQRNITFDGGRFASAQTITLGVPAGGGTLTIPSYTTITGPTTGSGASLTNLLTINGNDQYRIFNLNNGTVAAAISNLTIFNASAGSNGGAILTGTNSSLTIDNCILASNLATSYWSGGAIASFGDLIVTRSTFVDNVAGVYGGAIVTYPGGNLTVVESTFTNNISNQGGAIYALGAAEFVGNTISGNSAGVGGGIFNGSAGTTASNNLVAGNTGHDCSGVGCSVSAKYLVISGSEKPVGSGWDQGTITVSLSDSAGNQYSYFFNYGQFSTPASLASAIGGGVSNTYGGTLDAEGFGSLVEFTSAIGATLSSITVTNPSVSFVFTPITVPPLLSGNGNVSGGGANLAALGSVGGPTPTMLPLPGSTAICAGSAALALDQNGNPLTLDQRGVAMNAGGYCPAGSVDAGAVQTDYALSFSQQPTANSGSAIYANLPFTTSVTVDENNNPLTAGSATIAMSLSPSSTGTLAGTTSQGTAAGTAQYNNLTVIPAGNDSLVATLALTPPGAQNPVVLTANSAGFGVHAQPTTITVIAPTGTYTYNPSAAQTIPLQATVLGVSMVVAPVGTVMFAVEGPTGALACSALATVNFGYAGAPCQLAAGARAGIYSISASYSDGSGVYAQSNVLQRVVFSVGQATPPISWGTPSAITYGTPLGASQLSASSTVAGTFSYSPAAGTVLTAGSHTIGATFTPADTTDYTTATASVTLVVNQATPSISWATPAAIVYGTPLGAAQLDASSSIAGNFVYTPAAGTVLIAGSHSLTANFTPADTTDYTAATGTVALVVTQASSTITWPTPAAIGYGTTLGSAQLDATSPVPGSITYSPAAGTLLTVGSHTITATFTPTDGTDYTGATASVNLVVSQATPTVNWPVPAAIPYGTALSVTQLDATSPVAGSFAYVPAAGAVLGTGSQTLMATFTPADTTDYTPATASTTLTVNHATPGIALTASANEVFASNSVTFTATVSTASGSSSSAVQPSGSVAFYDGTTQLGTATISAGSVAYTTSSLNVGTHSITAVYSGDGNYVTVTSTALSEVVVNISVAPPSGGSTSATISPGGQAVYSLVFSPPSGTTFPSTINLAVSGLPSGATATFSPASIPAGASATTVTLTVDVPSSSAMLLPGRLPRFGLTPVALGLIILPFAVIRRKRLRLPARIVSVLLLSLGSAALILGLGACGGSSSSSPQPQTYSLTVTATSGTLSSSTNLTLTVE